MASNKDNSFRLVVKCVLDNEEQFFEFDTVESKSTTLNSEITQQPIVNGDMIADHMYRLPASISFSGKFSLNGNKGSSYSGPSDRLTNIENVFERIKNEGIMCSLLVLNRSDNSTIRFKKRDNMVLTSITWTERQNSMDFSFTFVEALTVDVDTITYEVDVTDPNLPAITDASTLDFTDTLLNWEEVDRIVIRTLIDYELINEEFLLNAVEKAGQGFVVGLAIGTATGFTILIGLSAIFSTIPFAGWVAAGLTAAVGCLVGMISGIFKGIKQNKAKRQFGIEQFKLYKDDRKNQAEVERFANYIGNIHQNLERLKEYIQVYGISKNENQECMLYIDDKYYVFTFTRNNITASNTNAGTWSLQVTNIDGNVVAEQGTLTPLSHIGECTSSNYLFRTEGGGLYVYVLNLKLFDAEENGKSQTEINDNILSDLRTYAIMVSRINMDEFTQVLTDIILDGMKQ